MNENKEDSLPRASAITAAVIWFLVSIALAFVVPKFTNIFTSMLGDRGKLPLVTQIVIGMKPWMFFLQALLIPGALIGKDWLVSEATAKVIDRIATYAAVAYLAVSVLVLFLPILQLQKSLSHP